MKSPIVDQNAFVSGMVLKELIPKGSIVESFLLYAGEMELSLSSKDRLVIAHTNKYSVYEFWWMAKNRTKQIASLAQEILPGLTEDILYRLQDDWMSQRDPAYRSALFYILNRCSSNGRVTCGKIDKAKLSPITINRFKNMTIENLHLILDKSDDVHNSFSGHNIKSDFRFFPVGHFGLNLLDAGSHGATDQAYLNHDRLYRQLLKADAKWIILYKYHKKVIEKYKGYNIIMNDAYGNRTRQIDNCEDIIVTNF